MILPRDFIDDMHMARCTIHLSFIEKLPIFQHIWNMQ